MMMDADRQPLTPSDVALSDQAQVELTELRFFLLRATAMQRVLQVLASELEHRYSAPGFLALGLGGCASCKRVGGLLHMAASVTVSQDLESWMDELTELRSYQRRMSVAWDMFMDVLEGIVQSDEETCRACRRVIRNFYSKRILMVAALDSDEEGGGDDGEGGDAARAFSWVS